MMPLSTCCRRMSGLTAWPQSTAQTMRSTFRAPSLPTCTCATSAAKLPKSASHGDAAAAIGAERRAPAGALRGEVQHAPQPRRLAQQLAAVVHRIAAGEMRRLVDAALDGRGVAGGADAAPVARQHALGRLVPDVLHPLVRDVVGALGAAGDVEVDAVLEQDWQEPRHDRGADHAMPPGDRQTVGAEPDHRAGSD